MATGTPVIASRLGALAEMVAPEENGLLFTPGDADDLARAVDALRQAPTEPLRTGARRTFEERYTEEANYRTLISIYETALERASPRS
jgi:glycosyltransferase involved in cell wall biosynthesis